MLAGVLQMGSPFKYIKHLEEKVFVGIIGLELLKTLIVPNPLDVLILTGLIFVFIWCFGDDWR
jgi:hypothetical protein